VHLEQGISMAQASHNRFLKGYSFKDSEETKKHEFSIYRNNKIATYSVTLLFNQLIKIFIKLKGNIM
jgi:hypothetical protein